MNKLVFLLPLLLAACDPAVLGTATYPDLPNIDKPEVILLPVQADIPRDMSKTQVKDIPECKVTPTPPNCLENKPLSGTNIFIGFDQANWINWQANFGRLQNAIKERDIRIDEVNRQHDDWRAKNKENEKK